MRVVIGKVESLPRDRCVAIGDGKAAAAIVGEEVIAFRNQCLHQESPLEGGAIQNGVLICPLHFWRYRLPDCEVAGKPGNRLIRYPVVVENGIASADLPDPVPEKSMRERLLEHAREWSRE